MRNIGSQGSGLGLGQGEFKKTQNGKKRGHIRENADWLIWLDVHGPSRLAEVS